MGMPLRILKFAIDFLGAGDDGFLAGDLAKFLRRGIQKFGILAGFAQTDVDGNLGDFGHSHDVFPAKALHQRGRCFLAIFVLQSALHFL